MSFSNLFKEFKSSATWLQFPFVFETKTPRRGGDTWFRRDSLNSGLERDGTGPVGLVCGPEDGWGLGLRGLQLWKWGSKTIGADLAPVIQTWQG